MNMRDKTHNGNNNTKGKGNKREIKSKRVKEFEHVCKEREQSTKSYRSVRELLQRKRYKRVEMTERNHNENKLKKMVEGLERKRNKNNGNGAITISRET